MQSESLKRKRETSLTSAEHHKLRATDVENVKRKPKPKRSIAQADAFAVSGEGAKRKGDTLLPGEIVLTRTSAFRPKPISKQPEEIRSLMIKAANKNFHNSVPYVFALKEGSRVSLLPDLNSTVQHMCENIRDNKGVEHSLGEVWRQMAKDWQFFAFVDKDSQAIRIGTIDELKKENIFGGSILGDLLLAGEELGHDESRAIYKELTENGILSKAFYPFLKKAEREIGRDAQRWGAEELLISASADGCIYLVESLLKKKVDPNAFSSATGHHAINAVKEGSEAYKLLVAYGANTEAKTEDPDC